MVRATPLSGRCAPVDLSPEDIRALGYQMVDRIADFYGSIRERPVTPGEAPAVVRQALGDESVPRHGMDAERLLSLTADLLTEHSLFNGHPRFWGYITSSPTPIGALGDFLAAAINANSGAWQLSPMATEIERQTVHWIAEMMGYPADCGGLLVSGGNMANFVGFLAARKAQVSWDIRSEGLRAPEAGQLCVYTSKETHTWVEKAADLYGLGASAIRWIPTDDRLSMDTAALRHQVAADRDAGNLPFLVVGTAGSVSTGAIDPLPELAAFCREQNLWFHVDGAYGGFAAMLPDASSDLKGLSEADSVAVDPHKWLYAPLEAGCVLVRDPGHLRDAFSFHPPYYLMEGAQEDPPTNFHDYGPQNSRGFRALKVWLALRQVGMDGYVRMISDDIELARHLYRCVDAHPELQAFTQGLSITTFRYVPQGVENEPYLNELNTELVQRIQASGEAFVSNAVINGAFLLRACVVNFRTTTEDIEALPEIVTRIGKEIHAEVRRPVAYRE